MVSSAANNSRRAPHGLAVAAGLAVGCFLTWNVSNVGAVADPLADRLMIGTAAILMLATGRVPIFAALVIIARDVALVLGYKVLSPGGYDLEVTFLGKTATWTLYASLGFVLVTAEGTTWPLVLLWIGIALSLGGR